MTLLQAEDRQRLPMASKTGRAWDRPSLRKNQSRHPDLKLLPSGIGREKLPMLEPASLWYHVTATPRN